MTKPSGQERPVLTLRELNRAMLARQLLLERARIGVVAAIERLAALQAQWAPSPYLALWSRLEAFRREGLPAVNINIAKRLSIARDQMARASSPAYLEELRGTIGADPNC